MTHRTVEDMSVLNSELSTDEHSLIEDPGSEYQNSAYGSGYESVEDPGPAGRGSTKYRTYGQRSMKNYDSAIGQYSIKNHDSAVGQDSIKNHDSAVGQDSTEYHGSVDQDLVEGNDQSLATTACLEGLVRTDGHGRQLVLLDGNTVYWRGHQSMPTGKGRVKVMAGHRGGHYPTFARYVGAGMLDAAVAGLDPGRHPNTGQVLTAIRELDDRCGVLVLVASETEAILNYGIAAQQARTQGINVKLLAVGDDLIRSRSTDGVRRRGSAGIVLICKIAGALAAGGHTLTKIFAVCQRLSMDRVATVNAVISSRKRTLGEDTSTEYNYFIT
ncbi:unnamed protein product [Macrosiphum euphorbiae]|uniref:DhaK domain-containing protein n=1 Tax=Macrosiphum euphorbiae TaxID=13131 RepID=A0AAV0XRR0_9HEMI|nr:unnamed protein product [Macrosiphum euphorbiae]